MVMSRKEKAARTVKEYSSEVRFENFRLEDSQFVISPGFPLVALPKLNSKLKRLNTGSADALVGKRVRSTRRS